MVIESVSVTYNSTRVFLFYVDHSILGAIAQLQLESTWIQFQSKVFSQGRLMRAITKLFFCRQADVKLIKAEDTGLISKEYKHRFKAQCK